MATAVVRSEAAPRWRPRLPERLPALRGRWLTAYSICWMVLLAFALVGDVGGAAYRLKLAAGETYTWGPLGLYLADEGAVVRNVAGDAQRAGIRPGDSILAVDGFAVPLDSKTSDQSNALENKLQQIAEGKPVRLTVRATGGVVHEAAVVRRAANAKMLYSGTGLTPDSVTWFCAVCFLLVPLVLLAGASMLFGRRRDPEAALLSITFLAIASGSGGMLWSRLIGAGPYTTIQDILIVFGVSGFFIALTAFPTGKFELRWAAAIALAGPVLVILGRIFPDSIILEWFGDAFVVPVLMPMIIRYRRASQDERQQWRWALLGFVGGLGFVISRDLIYGAYLKTHSGLSVDLWTWIVNPTTTAIWVLLMVAGLILSVLRYRLYDASAAVSRSAAYGVLTLAFVALFAGVEKLTEIIGERYFEHSVGIAAGAIGAAVAAVCIVPLHNRVHRWAERRFQKPLIRLREGLPECLADLRESVPVDQLVLAVTKRVEAGVRSTREAVVLREGGKWRLAGTHGVAAKDVREWQRGWIPAASEHALDCQRADALFPFRLRLCIETGDEPETIGWLLLGPRPDGSLFGKDERETLEHVAGPIARAIHIAQLRERREADAEQRLGALEALLAKVASAIGGGAAAEPA